MARTSATAQLGIIGLGRMGANLARQALERGYRVVGHTKGRAPPLRHARYASARSVEELVARLKRPRKILIYVPAGAAVDEVRESLAPLLHKGDIVMDGGNSYWGDSIRRAREEAAHGIHWLDVGTSGGISGARDGACFMVGGERAAAKQVEPMLRKLAERGGYVYAGGPGAGHFTKLVHNGIEFGMLQAFGEGVALLRNYPEKLPVSDIAECWRHGSVIRSWLLDLLVEQLHAKPLDQVPPIVEDTGEVNWLVADAMELEVPVPVIAQAVQQLVASREGRSDAARAIALMRHGFGGHPFGASRELQRERRTSRIGTYIRPARSRA